MRYAAVALVILLSASVSAQVNYRPTDPPIVTAENDSWYRLGEPVIFSGEFYYPTGPLVFFDGDVMVRTGHNNGVPLYADTTIEPYSVVLVPVGNLMRPYERLRSGELAGTSGSRAPSFPGRSDTRPHWMAGAGGPPSNLPLPIGALSTYTLEPPAEDRTSRHRRPKRHAAHAAPVSALTSVAPQRTPPPQGQPFRYDSISVQFRGEKWVMEGPSVPMPDGLDLIADYKGFPVYARSGGDRERIYLPFAPGRVAPFTSNR